MVDDVLQLHQKEDKKERKQEKWKLPADGVLKLNTDGAFDGTKFRGGTGAVIRDSRGSMIRAESRWYDHLEDAEQAEALAVRDGLKMALLIGATSVVAECSTVVNLLNNQEGARSTLASIWQDIQELSRNFDYFCLRYVNREANMAAHCCAKFADPVNCECIWENGAPNFLAGVLANDCNPVFLI